MALVFIPVALWILVVGAYFGIRRRRSVSFVVTLVVGGIGFVIWGIGLIGMISIPDDGSYSQALSSAVFIVVGGALLLIGTLMGLVSVLVPAGSNVDREGQPGGSGSSVEGPAGQFRPAPDPEKN